MGTMAGNRYLVSNMALPAFAGESIDPAAARAQAALFQQ